MASAWGGLILCPGGITQTCDFTLTVPGEAFDLMYSATRTALNDRFAARTDPAHLVMTLVGPQEETTILDKF